MHFFKIYVNSSMIKLNLVIHMHACCSVEVLWLYLSLPLLSFINASLHVGLVYLTVAGGQSKHSRFALLLYHKKFLLYGLR